jgi:hypothetical protein
LGSFSFQLLESVCGLSVAWTRPGKERFYVRAASLCSAPRREKTIGALKTVQPIFFQFRAGKFSFDLMMREKVSSG